MLRAAREKVWVTPKESRSDSQQISWQKHYKPVFDILKGKNFQPRISYPAKLSFISEGEIKSFADKQLLRDFFATRPAIQELLKEALNMERNNQYQPLKKHTKLKKTINTIKKLYQLTGKKPSSIKMARSNSHITILTLNVNGLNTPIKRH